MPATPAAHGVSPAHYALPRKPHDDAAANADTRRWRLPSGGSGLADLAAPRSAAGQAPGTVSAPGTPVWVRRAPAGRAAGHGPAQVAVTVADRATAAAAGVDGVVFTAAEKGGTGPVTLGVDYRRFAGALGGNYGSRLRLVALPACALTTPGLASCRTRTPLPGSRNDVRRQSVYATLDPVGVPAAGTAVLAATTTGPADGGNDGGSPAGTYGATTLSASSSWSGGGSAGSFTYSYPIDVPPAASDLVPSVGLAYDSGSVDGQTAASQAQANWLGDGWSTPRSYIEQSFASCSDSPEGTPAPKATADRCYDGPVLTMSLNGSVTSLVWDADSRTYTPADDNGEVVRHVTGSGNGSGTHDADYWEVTDRTGTVFSFGRNRLPGWTTGSPATNSVDSEPVYSAHSGDPCYNATWSSSWCTMAYRWNLDYVKDTDGNAMAYYYKQDTNAYARDADTSGSTVPKANSVYVRDSHLDRIDYGFTDGNAYTANGGHAPEQVVLTTGDRCLTGTCSPLDKTNAANWPDVPYDLNCTSGADCYVTSPSYWSSVRLTGIRTQVWNGTAYAAVDSWAFTQTLPATGDGTSPTLWLSKIVHTGSDTTAGGAVVTLPPVTFTAKEMANRLDTVTDGLPALARMRISSVTSETGAVTGVNYTLTDPCDPGAKPAPATNTSSCYPVYWTPKDNAAQLLDWFNKYQVSSVTQADPTGGAPTLATSYAYLGGGAWHYDDNELVKAEYRTYGQWRGFGRVQTFTGQGADARTKTEDVYYRGMSKDNSTTAVTLTDSQGGTHEDIDQLAGDTLESTTYDYDGGPVTGSTVNSYWVSAPTATRTRKGLPALTANATAQVEEWTRQALTDGTTTTWRKTETDTSNDTDTSSPTFGLPLVVYDHGDLSRTDQPQCAVTTYAPAAGANLTGLPAEVETDSVACGGQNPGGASAPTAAQTNALTAPTGLTRPDDVVSDVRTYYDNPTLAATWPQPASPAWPQAAPTRGHPSVTRTADGYSAGAYTFRTDSAQVYDAYGRPTDSYDALGHKTHISYTMANGLTTEETSANPLGQVTATGYDPQRGLPVSQTDPNGITTTVHYDGLGRRTAVWGYGRGTALPADRTFDYQVSRTAPTVVTTHTMNDAQGYATSTTVYDALLRPRQTQNPTPQGGRLVSDTFYDTRGWTWKTNNSWWDATAPPGTGLVTVPDSQVADQDVTSFDGAGRPVLVTSYDDSQVVSGTATSYDGAATGGGDESVTVPLDASGRPYDGATAKETVTDALGRTAEVRDYTTAPTVTVTTSGATAPVTTVNISGGSTTAANGRPQAIQYLFDAAGNQSDVKNLATGDDWHTDHNLLGQATTKRDPDAGTSTVAYDAAGNVIQTTDARGRTLSFTYDALNRKTGQYAAPVAGQAPANQVASWVYDNSDNAVPGMSDPMGKLTSATSYVAGSGPGGQAYTDQIRGFNAWGEPIGETVTIPSGEGALAGSYTFTHLYTSGTGLPWRDVYPATGSLPAETVTHGYSTALDVPDGLAGLANYTVATTWNAYGRIGRTELGSTSAHADITNTYDPHTGALTDTKTADTALSSTPIDHTSYAYDPAGNPVRQTETREGTTSETQCFRYDALDRLTQAWTATDTCQADPAGNNGSTVGSGITGAAYWTNWAFNPLGQRTRQTDHGLSGTADTVTTYTYDGNGAGQPHTLTGTSTTGPSGTATASYGYDKNGETTSRSAGQGAQTLTWDDLGRLTAVTGSTGGDSAYVYGADGGLLLQKDPGTTTLYLPGEQIALDTGTSAITGTRFYDLPGGGEAVRTGGGTAYAFEVGDQQGTATLTLTADLATPTWRQQTPYGAPRGTAPAGWPDNHAFLGKPADTATGLTAVGARWYDPATGTFASLDPLFEETDAQQQAGYNYAGSNPVTHSDPSGLTHCDVGVCPTPWQSVHGPNYCETHHCGSGPRHGRYNGPAWQDPDLNRYSGNPTNRHRYSPSRYAGDERYWSRRRAEAERREQAIVRARIKAEKEGARRANMLNLIIQAQHAATQALQAGKQDGGLSLKRGWNSKFNLIRYFTIGYCAGGSAGFGYGVEATGCVVLAGGHPGVTFSIGNGVSTPQAGVNGGVLLSNARSIKEMSGPSQYFGDSAGEGPELGYNVSRSKGEHNRPIATGYLFGGGGPPEAPPVSVSIGEGETWSWGF
ncbi:RHS repeat-associated core domain-containing protein [Streptomyces sp. HPF1205]|uniref:RHS repeat domain-containing protein n=1 Tax=Streptomyces sp. HPF1205 TaxID=2873262 RepID=UPI0021F1518A|nr:RHS repeat-associated core domain-containing protein [Streptomyces sp. HPF1205]